MNNQSNKRLASPPEAPPAAGAAQAVDLMALAKKSGAGIGWSMGTSTRPAAPYIYKFTPEQLTMFAALAATPAPQEVTEAMVTVYLKTNDAYWKRTDELPATNPGKWRNGTPREATRESLKAALKAAHPGERKDGNE